MKPTAIICDIDGTLAHMSGRSPYDPSKYHEDTVDEVVKELVNYLAERWVMIIVSGRDDHYWHETEKWLRDNGVEHEQLIMRRGGDKREDSIIKREIYLDYIEPKYKVLLVLDDRNRVVKMWREQGLKCLQVQEGDF